MWYNSFKEMKISALGMGNMRLPVVDGNNGAIDEEKAEAIIKYAYENGINYFDTAFMYHDGNSESFVGKVLSQYPRESYYLASKMPGSMISFVDGKFVFKGALEGKIKADSLQDIFEIQLDRCKTDYFDFYLLHNVSEPSYDLYTNDDAGIVKYLLEEKEKGRIRHLGFSAHGSAEMIKTLLDKYPGCFEFAQIQLNYLDWTLQDAKAKYELLTERNIPVLVMEPCRGGALANVNEKAEALMKDCTPDKSVASWAFRYLQGLDNVMIVLSGMSTMEQLEENLATFEEKNPLNEKEAECIEEVVKTMVDMIPCTACRYCCDVCPAELNIPKIISMYNETSFDGKVGFTVAVGLKALGDDKQPKDCIGCEACKSVCPQEIDITGIMEKFAERIEENTK